MDEPDAVGLAAEFQRAVAAQGQGAAAEDGSLEDALRDAVVRARQARPTLRIDDAAWVRHLACHLPAMVQPAEWLGTLHAGDSYLAFGCSLGDPSALAALESTHFGALGSALARIGLDGDEAADVLQRLRVDLLIGHAGAPPRIAQYSGRGGLGGWLRVAAMRAAVHARSRSDPLRRGAHPDLDELIAETAGADVQYLRFRHRPDFEQALGAALDELEPRQRTLLRLCHVEGLKVSQLATIYGTDQSTISRRVSRARAHLVRAMRRHLQARLAVTGSELESLVRAVGSDLRLSMTRLLARQDATGRR